jgi:arylsulfatase A-like enzyme
MAREGIRFTDFQVAAAVCSASRVALLTGCYPQRVSVLGALGPQSVTGINENETLISELLKGRGYATGAYGKWHLGHHRQFLPMQHGFDDYFGLPYSNDMWPKHPTDPNYPELPLIDKNEVIQTNPDQSKLTTWYTERAVDFIRRHKEQPFFLYVAHNMPHVPLFVSDKFAGKSPRGLYGDVIAEVDWSVGQILRTLEDCGLDENTLVWFTSDNGPWLSYGNHAGSAGPLREGKGTTWEGGHRVPSLVRWTGRIPAGVTCRDLASTLDILPTLACLAGATLPTDRKIDGHDIWPLLANEPEATSPHDVFYYYWNRDLEAVRRGQWKLHFPHQYRSLSASPGRDGQPHGYRPATVELALFDLGADVGERSNVADLHAEIVADLKQLAEAARDDLGDNLTHREGRNVRVAGRVE